MSKTAAIGKDERLRIAFVHPDLGIGGAERLVVDAAVGLQEQGHNVTIYTSHCDKNHCFEEVKNGLLRVEVYGDQLPTNFLNKFYIVFANLRQLYLVLHLYLMGKINQNDLYIVDQLSSCIPFLHLVTNARLMFYCHFPDQLLAQRTSLIKKLYRVPFDIFEQFTMSAADCVVVNSYFTRSIYHKTFRLLRGEPDVIYPCVDLSVQPLESLDEKFLHGLIYPHQRFYLSINRFERKKNILLALESYALSSERDDHNSKLILCGGYDERVSENVAYLRELHEAANNLHLSHTTIFYPEFRRNRRSLVDEYQATNSKVIFLTSISSSLKELLLSKMELLLYTPSFEHFGIVPLEAMKHGKPVLAVNSGGPLETVENLTIGVNENEATGWLERPIPRDWARSIEEFKLVTRDKKVDFKKNGSKRVKKYYSRKAMTENFEKNIRKTFDRERKTYFWETFVVGLLNLCLHLSFQFILEDKIWPYIGMSIVMGLYFHSVFTLFWVFLSLAKIIR